MDVSIPRLNGRLPDYRTQNGPDKDGIMLATALVVGLIGFVPAFTMIVWWIDVPLPLPDLVGVAIVLATYAVLILLLRRALVGSAIALVVFATFAANVPLLSGATNLPGQLGPQLWLFEIPLVVLAVYHLYAGNYSFDSFSLAEVALGGLVLWSVVAAFFGATRRLDVALFYSVFLCTIWLAFTVTSRTVREAIIGYRTLLTAFVIAMCGHALFGITQFANQSPFGLGHLGETSRVGGGNTLALEPLSEFAIGVLISGFTGGGEALSVLLAIAVPICLAFVFDARGVWRISALAGVSLCVTVLRLTARDAARGVVIITIVCFVAIYLWREREAVCNVTSRAARQVALLIAIVSGTIGIVLAPASQSGASSEMGVSTLKEGRSSGGTVGTSAGSGGSSGAAASKMNENSAGSGGGTTGVDSAEAARTGSDLTSLSIPYFSLKSLGIRIQQYVAGLDMAIKHPVFGIGGANYSFFAADYGLPARFGSGWFSLHNQYISILAGTGVPGFVAYGVCLVAVLREGWRTICYRRDEWLPVGVFTAFIGFLAFAFWIADVRYGQIAPLWILGGAIIGRR